VTNAVSHAVNGLAFGSLLFLLASGLTVTFGLMRTVNLAHGALYAIGGYVALDVYRRTGWYSASLAAAVIVAAAVGIAMHQLILRRLAHQELPQIIVTVGLALVFADVLLATYGGRPQNLPRPPGFTGVIRLGEFQFPTFRLALIGVAILVYLLLALLSAKTRLGAKVRAAVDDEPIARSVGVPVSALFVGVFALGSALAGFAGVWGGAFTGLAPGSEWEILLLSLVVVVVGGLGSLNGAFVAAFVVGLLDAFGKWLFPEFALFTLYAPVVLLLALKPSGLFGRDMTVSR
jgi:branched-chain amino acid transport system permease protein